MFWCWVTNVIIMFAQIAVKIQDEVGVRLVDAGAGDD